jgi:hypothetical protein
MKHANFATIVSFCHLVAVQNLKIDETYVVSLLALEGNVSSQDHSLLSDPALVTELYSYSNLLSPFAECLLSFA